MSMVTIQIPYSIVSTLKDALTENKNRLYRESLDFSEPKLYEALEKNLERAATIVKQAQANASHLVAISAFLELLENHRT